jgi:glutamate-1-semialdehyde 2,1-aminomutase
MGLVPPLPGFLDGLREICDRHGALLIFDEVMTGFRVGFHCAQGHFGVQPDLTCFGKVVGGGMPAAAYGGPRSLMSELAPVGPVYQAGTLSGNPLAMAAGIETLRRLAKKGTYEKLSATAEKLAAGFQAAADEHSIGFTSQSVGAMWGYFFQPGPVRNFSDAQKSDGRAFKRFFSSMLEQGVYLAPSPYEAAFVSLAHTSAQVDTTIRAAQKAMGKVARKR